MDGGRKDRDQMFCKEVCSAKSEANCGGGATNSPQVFSHPVEVVSKGDSFR